MLRATLERIGRSVDVRDQEDELFLANEHLVEEIVKRHLAFGIPEDILLEKGFAGLRKASQIYEPGNKPFTYVATWWIKKYVSDLILSSRPKLIRTN